MDNTATFIYRGIVSAFIAATFFLVRENYSEFKELKKNMQAQEVKNVIFDNRLSNVEAKVFLIEKRK